ncbi:MAG: cyclase family protein [Chloroflexi bacterium]|nr:cyclase family protein [Chloroflexota bacterium]
MKIHDISVPISAELPVYPGDAGVSLTPVARMAQGAVADVSLLSLGTHTGTHVDPPGHFLPGGATVDALPLEVLIGPAWVADARGLPTITRPVVEQLDIPVGAQRVLFRTDNSELWERREFVKDFVYLEGDAARWLVERGVRLVGIDYLSVERFGFDRPEAHLTLLGAGVVILEGLDLRAVRQGPYTLLALPLKIQGGDGAPARVVLLEGELP